MNNNNDLLAHLKETEAVIKDWPAWKKNIWPETSVGPSAGRAGNGATPTKGNLVAELATLQRHRAAI